MKAKKKILVSKTFSKAGYQAIKESLVEDFDVIRSNAWQSDKENNEASALVIRSKDKINSSFLEKFKNLELVVSATSGFDHIEYKNISLPTYYCPEANTQSATELSLFHILNFLKKGHQVLNPKSWREDEMLSSELTSKTVSIIGFGRIGSKLAKTLDALGCEEIKIYDPYLSKEDISAVNKNFKYVNLEDALSSDVISLHCPLTRKTQKIINKESLKYLKPSSLLINCARGELIDTRALLESLDKREILGACLDVFEEEPLSLTSLLRDHPLISWSPHIGAYTEQAQIKSALEAAQQIKSWFKGDQDMLHSLPPRAAWAADL